MSQTEQLHFLEELNHRSISASYVVVDLTPEDSVRQADNKDKQSVYDLGRALAQE